MRFLSLLVPLVLASLLAPRAEAALPYAPEWSWTAPTQNVDGSSIPATGGLALKEYRFYCAQPPAVPSKTATPIKVVLHPTLVWNTPAGVFTTGNWACAVSAVNNNGEESALTTALPFTIAPVAPKPPSALTVQ